MKHYPAKRPAVALAGLEFSRPSHAPFVASWKTAVLALACAFAAGFSAATWFIALVIERTP